MDTYLRDGLRNVHPLVEIHLQGGSVPILLRPLDTKELWVCKWNSVGIYCDRGINV